MDESNQVLLKNREATLKSYVDTGCSLAEAFLKTFAEHDLSDQTLVIDSILRKFSIPDLQIGTDYFFADGSRLNIDPGFDSMLATKGLGTPSRRGV